LTQKNYRDVAIRIIKITLCAKNRDSRNLEYLVQL